MIGRKIVTDGWETEPEHITADEVRTNFGAKPTDMHSVIICPDLFREKVEPNDGGVVVFWNMDTREITEIKYHPNYVHSN